MTLLEDHCHHFETGEENKLVYTTVFEEYTDAIERLIEGELERRIAGFDMEAICIKIGIPGKLILGYRVAIQLAKIWLEFWLQKRLEIPF